MAMARALATVFSLSEYQLIQDEDNDSVERLTSEISLLDVDDSVERGGGKNVTCLACGISSFESLVEQREHFKTDWHRYNVKMRVLNRSSVDEDEFNGMVERDDDVGSISGSDDGSDVEDAPVAGNGVLSPYCIFNVVGDGEIHHVGVWKCLVVADDRKRGMAEDVSGAFDTVLSLKSGTQQWAVLMLQGGHFAGCIYRIQEGQCKNKAVHEAADSCVTEIKHKSFHRYVVRAKAGGKQSDKDATGKFAKSAGSRLRRYNEAVLQKDIVETLDEWHDMLSECSLIFVSTPGSNRLVLFGGEHPPLDKKDERIRKIPFITRRPTISETKRVVRTLLTMYRFDLGPPEERRKCVQETEKGEQLRQQAEDKRLAAKLELQRQEELGKERNRRKKQRQKEQKRRLKMQECNKEDDAIGPEKIEEIGPDEVDVDAELKSLAASALVPSGKSAPAKKESKARSSLSSKDLASRREKMAAAAEARAKALKAACNSQKLYQ